MKTVTVDDVKNEDYMSKLDVLKKEKDKRGQRMKTMVDLKP